MGGVTTYRELNGWLKAMDLVEMIYRITKDGAFAKDFGLRDQIRRASVSIPSNIAEGFERFAPREYYHFVVIALGSIAEVSTQLEIAYRVGYLNQTTFDEIMNQAIEVSRLVHGLRRSLAQKLER